VTPVPTNAANMKMNIAGNVRELVANVRKNAAEWLRRFSNYSAGGTNTYLV